MKIAPPDAPANGYNYGKGLYFADAFAKSMDYCTFNDEGVGLLLLCEVALGNSKVVTEPENITKLPDGVHSVKCTGDFKVNKVKNRTGLLIPDEKLDPDEMDYEEEDFSEYIVYNEAQVRIKYLVMIKISDH